MKRRNEHHHELPHDREDLFAELSRPVGVPDMTRSIMGRLGYMKIDPVAARRRRVKRWSARTAVLGLMLAGIISGIHVFNHSDAVRRPHEVTIPSAIGQDVEQHQQRLNTLIRVLQSSTPKHESPHLSPFVPVSTDERDVMLPEIDFDHHEPEAPAEPDWIDDPSEEAIEEINFPAIAAVRWV